MQIFIVKVPGLRAFVTESDPRVENGPAEGATALEATLPDPVEYEAVADHIAAITGSLQRAPSDEPRVYRISMGGGS